MDGAVWRNRNTAVLGPLRVRIHCALMRLVTSDKWPDKWSAHEEVHVDADFKLQFFLGSLKDETSETFRQSVAAGLGEHARSMQSEYSPICIERDLPENSFYRWRRTETLSRHRCTTLCWSPSAS